METSKTNKSINTTALLLPAKENKLNSKVTKELTLNFAPYFEQASIWRDKAEGLIVTDASQKDLMSLAKESRLALKKIRCNVENTRKDLQDDTKRYTKAVNDTAKVIKSLIEPIEKHLEKQEKFVEIQQANALNEIANERTAELLKYNVDISLYDLRTLSKEQYTKLLNDSKVLYKQAIEDAKGEAEKLAEENKRLEAEKEKLAQEREEMEAERTKLFNEQEKQRKENEKIEAEKRAEQAKKDAEIKAENDANRAKLNAPDKEKLLDLANMIASFKLPEVDTEAGQIIINNTCELLSKTSNYITANAVKL